MAYQERGSGPPHFDGKNYQMWSKRMAAFLRGKGQILWDVTVDIGYVQPMNFLALGSRDMFDANNKAMPDEEFDVLGEDELALLMRRFERLHENRVNMRRNTRTCFQCGKTGHFVADCPEKIENNDGYKH
jgi:hypothetical protein